MGQGVAFSQEELMQRVKKIAGEVFGLKINVPVLISKRMTRAWGLYHWKLTPKTREPLLVQFKFAYRLVTSGDYPIKVIDDCIKHELCHWFTDHTEGRICGHDVKFYSNCRRFGINPSRLNQYQKVNQGR